MYREFDSAHLVCVARKMSWSELFAVKFDDYTGYVKSVAEARQLIDVFKQETLTDYNRYKRTKLFGCGRNVDGAKRLIFWGDEEKNEVHHLFDGIPFIVLGREVLECHRGPDRNIYNKTKYKQMVESENYTKKRRLPLLMQTSKKTGCTAKLYMKEVVKFPNYKLQPGNDTKSVREQSCKELKDVLRTRQTVSEMRIYISLPKDGDHQNHTMGKESGEKLKMDERLSKFIETKVSQGDRSFAAINNQLRNYVTALFPMGNLPPETSRRFYPKKADVQSKIAQCVRNLRAKQIPRVAIESAPVITEIIADLATRFPSDFCIMKIDECDLAENTKKNPLFFMYQTSYQNRLLAKYGNEICVLDTAFKNSKDALQFYFLYVKTNVNFSIVGCIATREKSQELLQDGLRVLKDLNPAWKPQYFLSRMDKFDIEALEQEFPACNVYINDLSREYDWMNWTSKAGHNILNPQMAMRFLRKVSDAVSDKEYRAALKSLQGTYMWKINPKFRDWFSKTWLAEEKRWCRVFQQTDFLWKISTGANSQLKWQQGDCGANLLSAQELRYLNYLLVPLVTRTFPYHYQRYLDANLTDHLDIPHPVPVLQFLENMPKCHFEHVLKIYNLVLAEPIPTCYSLGDGHFLVVSGQDSEGNMLGTKITFGDSDNMPSCCCETWCRHRLPCSHFCVIFIQFPEWGWHSFPDRYRDDVFFALDRDAPPAPCHLPPPEPPQPPPAPVVTETPMETNVPVPRILTECNEDIDDILLIVASECEASTDEYSVTVKNSVPVDVRDDCLRCLSTLTDLVGTCGTTETLTWLHGNFKDVLRRVNTECNNNFHL